MEKRQVYPDWLNRDVAGMLKDWANPVTYGRLLCTARIFQPPDEKRARRKLAGLLATLPANERPKRPLNPYFCFCAVRRPELKQELPELSFVEVGRQLGLEWRRLTDEEKRPYIHMAVEDKARYQREKDPDVWQSLVARRQQVQKALAKISDDDEVLRLAKEARAINFRVAKREGRQIVRAMGLGHPGMICIWQETRS